MSRSAHASIKTSAPVLLGARVQSTRGISRPECAHPPLDAPTEVEATAMNHEAEADGRLASSGWGADLSELEPIHSGARHKLYRCAGPDAAVVLKRNAAASTSESAAASVRRE
jgi:hypothetical protein